LIHDHDPKYFQTTENILDRTSNPNPNSRKFIGTILAKSFDVDSVEEGREFPGENAQKFVHKLHKRQIEQWRHLANLAELLLWKDL